MALTEPSLRRLRPVRLTDIPVDQRIRAALHCARYAHTPDDAEELLAAALSPSQTVYYVTPDALARLAA